MISCIYSFTIAGIMFSLPLTATPLIEVSSQEALIDQEIMIKLRGLQPREEIQIQAQTEDANGVLWQSTEVFQSDDNGVIDLAAQAPLMGSYEGIDPMGFLWSMQPSQKHATFKVNGEHFSVNLSAYREKEKIASQDITRLRKAPNIKRMLVNESGLVGVLFLPPSPHPLPVIITLNGSNGGLSENRAQLLASHGFAVFALGYFGMEGLPSNLQEIPLEYFETAFAWIKQQPSIDSKRIGLYGISRGAELALILGAWYPDSIRAIAAVVPSSVVYPGLKDETPVPAWTYRGHSLCPFARVAQIHPKDGDDPLNPASILNSFLEGMKEKEAYEAAVIPVEKIQASLFLVSGGDDQMWPSALYASQIEQRLKDKGSAISCTHLHYPNAGHGIGIPHLPQPGSLYYHPVGKRWFTMGGTPADDQHASQDSWSKLIVFFETTL